VKKAVALLAILVLAACTSGGNAKQSGVPTVKLLAENLQLFSGVQQAVRLGFQTATGSTDIIADLKPDTAALAVCSLTSLGAELPPVAACKDVGSGVRETIASSGLSAVALVVSGVSNARANVQLEYDDGGHDVSVQMPFLAAPDTTAGCKDNGCNPFFELTPARNGPFSASAAWRGPGGTLVMLQGSVLGRSLTATGIPYREAGRADGKPPLSIKASLSAQGEYALVITQPPGPTAAPLENVIVNASWP
jgi:hypothetical protein